MEMMEMTNKQITEHIITRMMVLHYRLHDWSLRRTVTDEEIADLAQVVYNHQRAVEAKLVESGVNEFVAASTVGDMFDLQTAHFHVLDIHGLGSTELLAKQQEWESLKREIIDTIKD